MSQILQMERRDISQIQKSGRFLWHGRWYELGEKLGRPMAIYLEPNAPDGKPGKSGHAPPLPGFEVEVIAGTAPGRSQ